MVKCSDCNHELQQIYILDKDGSGRPTIGFNYTNEPPQKGFLGLKNIAGTIHAFMCPNCKKVHFYAFEGSEASSI